MRSGWRFCGLVCSFAFIGGCRVSEPGKIERAIMKQVKLRVTVGGKGTKNPVPATEESIANGRKHFGHHCGVCHGLDGQGTGVPFAEHMYPPVPSLASADIQQYEDGQLKWIIEKGIGPSGMPAWKDVLDEDEMWALINFMRRLPPKGSLGIPAVYKEAGEEHQNMHLGHAGETEKDHKH
jgi:mono/diheme cytochrome c family protein